MSSEALQKALKLADALENGDSYQSHSRPVYGWERDDPCFDAADALRGLVNQVEPQAARIASLEAERDQLRAEVERTANNRDMRKGQCEQQAAQLALLRAEVERLRKPLTDERICELWSWSASAEAERTATTQQHAFARAIEAAKEA